MIVYLPEIYPDELVYSWFCRYSVHLGCYSHKIALTDLFQKKSDNPSKEFVGNLNTQAKTVIQVMYDMEYLLLYHTMLPQYARFMTSDKKKKVIRMLSNKCDPHQCLSILPRVEKEQYLKYCPLCVKEDKDKYGETYWRRVHQIRNMTICTKHRCRLIASDVPVNSERCYTLDAADYHTGIGDIEWINDERLIGYSKYLQSVFCVSWEYSSMPISVVLYQSLNGSEYKKEGTKLYQVRHLWSDMQKYYQDMKIPDVASVYQIQRTLAGLRTDFTTICQIAFFLGISVEELTHPVLSEDIIDEEKMMHRQKGKMQIDYRLLDKELAPQFETYVKTIYYGTSNIRPERISERMIKREFNLTLQKLDKMPKCKKIYDCYSETYLETNVRKIIWAYNNLMDEKGEKFYWADIRKLSGVKKTQMRDAIAIMNRYANDKVILHLKKLSGYEKE